VAAKVLQVLQVVHEYGVVHRALSPKHIIFECDPPDIPDPHDVGDETPKDTPQHAPQNHLLRKAMSAFATEASVSAGQGSMLPPEMQPQTELSLHGVPEEAYTKAAPSTPFHLPVRITGWSHAVLPNATAPPPPPAASPYTAPEQYADVGHGNRTVANPSIDLYRLAFSLLVAVAGPPRLPAEVTPAKRAFLRALAIAEGQAGGAEAAQEAVQAAARLAGDWRIDIQQLEEGTLCADRRRCLTALRPFFQRGLAPAKAPAPADDDQELPPEEEQAPGGLFRFETATEMLEGLDEAQGLLEGVELEHRKQQEILHDNIRENRAMFFEDSLSHRIFVRAPPELKEMKVL